MTRSRVLCFEASGKMVTDLLCRIVDTLSAMLGAPPLLETSPSSITNLQ